MDRTIAPSKLPRTRAECPTVTAETPCPHIECRHHLWLETERAGRPHGGRRPLPVIRPKVESCALSVADREIDGAEPGAIATMLDLSVRRVEQLVARGVHKLRVADVLVEHGEALRDKLPAGAFVESILHRGGDNPRVVTITIVVGIDAMPPAAPMPSARRHEPETGIRITRDEHAAMRRTDPDRPRREGVARARERRAAAVADTPGTIEPGADRVLDGITR